MTQQLSYTKGETGATNLDRDIEYAFEAEPTGVGACSSGQSQSASSNIPSPRTGRRRDARTAPVDTASGTNAAMMSPILPSEAVTMLAHRPPVRDARGETSSSLA
jgi:hypothetical protein